MTLQSLEPSFWFIAGAALQARILLPRRMEAIQWKILGGMAILTGLFNLNGSAVGTLFFTVIFGIFFSIGFRKRILPFFNEQSALFYTLLFVYALACLALDGHPFARTLAFVSLVPTVALLGACFAGWEPSPGWRYAFYAWFVFANSALAGINLYLGQGASLLLDGELCLECRLRLLLAGMASLFLVMSAGLFLQVLFLDADSRSRLAMRRKRPSRADDWKAALDILKLHYLKRKLPVKAALALIVTESVLLWLNFSTQWLPAPVMISVTALLVPAAVQMISSTEKA